MALTCASCGEKQGFMAALNVDLGGAPYLCEKCQRGAFRAEQDKVKEEQKRVEAIRVAASKVIVTTTPKVDGFHVSKYIGIESVEFVIGTGAFSEITSSISDFFGTRSTAFERKLQAAKKHAMDAIKYLAAEQGANAVIGIDLDYAEFSGNRVALIINGTLVLLSRNLPSKPTK